MTNLGTVITTKDCYVKAPRFIDYHLTKDRSDNDVKQAKSIIKKIISYCINQDNGRKIVVDLENTEHIAKACIKIFAYFAQNDANFIMHHPNQAISKRLLDNAFPETNIA